MQSGVPAWDQAYGAARVAAPAAGGANRAALTQALATYAARQRNNGQWMGR
jgi:hypothetical protein